MSSIVRTRCEHLFWAWMVAFTAAACSGDGAPERPIDEANGGSGDPSAASSPGRPVELRTRALWTNGGFENDAIGVVPSSWSVTNYKNLGFVGTTSTPPTTFANLALGTPGVRLDETFVVGGSLGTQTDPDLGSGQTFRYPLYDSRNARVNYLNATENGKNRNANLMSQTMTIVESDRDSTDAEIHVRFAMAPVLEVPSHSYNQQPYYWVQLENVTRGTVLYKEFHTAGEAGVPWKTTTSVATSNTVQWLDWKLVDISPGSSALAVGDQVKLSVLASGCALGGHFGRVYVDGLGSQVPGPYTAATANKPSVDAGSTLTYTVRYANGGTQSLLGARVDFATPPQTTYSAIVPPAGITCTTPTSGAAGVISCPLGTLAAGANGSFTITVNVASNATGSVVAGDYSIRGTNAPTLLGATVTTPVNASAGSGSTADLKIEFETGGSGATAYSNHQALTWGQTTVWYIVKVTNPSTNTVNAQTAWQLPSNFSTATWCRLNGGSTNCNNGAGNQGTGSMTNSQSYGSAASKRYKIVATVVSGSGPGTVTNTFTAVPTGAFVDPNLADNSVSLTETIGTATQTLTVTKSGGAAAGTLTSSPGGIKIDTASTSGSYKYGRDTVVTLTAAPAFGYTFSSWSGNCSGSSPSCSVTMSADKSVTATFAAISGGSTNGIYVYSGGNQSTRTSTGFSQALKALVTDASGNPLASKTVTFTANAAGGATATLSSSTAVTDAYGVATITATANGTAGAYTVTATSIGAAGSATFNLTNVGSPASITYVAGGTTTDRNTAPINTQFNAALIAQVKDSAGRAVPGATVTFSVPGSGASGVLSSTSATTDAYGLAQVTVSANGSAGNWTASANTSGVGTTVSFELTNVTGTPTQIMVVSGTPQAAATGAAFPAALVAVVADAGGNPVKNVTVTFTPPGSNASATLSSSTATTDALGRASVTATANTTVGAFVVAATASGVSGAANFALTNLGSDTLALFSGNLQSATVGAAFGSPLKVILTTTSTGDPVAQGTTVTFTATGSCVTLSSGTANTDVDGYASVTATANNTAGSCSITASSTYSAPVTFTLTKNAGAATVLAVVSGTPQSEVSGAAFTNPLIVVVRDTHGNVVPGAAVTFSAPGAGATAALSSTTATTGSNGEAAISATAGTTAGTYNVTASVTGTSPVDFALTNDNCPSDPNKVTPGACGCGVADTDGDGDGTANCIDGCPSDANKIAAGVCGCGVADTDGDGDGTPNCNDGCPSDANKVAAGVCGCGVADTNTDGDAAADCNETCDADPNKTAPGACGCGVADTNTDGDAAADCNETCDNDPNKTAPGVCGCGVADTDSDSDGTPNCNDACPSDASKVAPGVCGCGVADTNTDGDAAADCNETCDSDPNKTAPGACGCGVADTNTDGDAAADCNETCDSDPAKTAPGVCGCGVADTNTDGDAAADCNETCDADPNKTAPGICGCGVADTNTDGDAAADCNETCDDDPNKTTPGACGCGVADTNTDGDAAADCNESCDEDPNKIAPGACGCGVADTDSDADETPDCHDDCPSDAGKTSPGACGCGVADSDSDGDTSPNCLDGCPSDANKIQAGECGCGVAETDSDEDGTPNCVDACPYDLNKIALGACGCGVIDLPGCVDNCPDDPNKSLPGICGCGVSDADSDGDGTANCLDDCPNDPLRTVPGVCGCGLDETDSDGDGVPNCQDLCPDDVARVQPGPCGCAGEHRRRPGWKRLMCQWVYE